MLLWLLANIVSYRMECVNNLGNDAPVFSFLFKFCCLVLHLLPLRLQQLSWLCLIDAGYETGGRSRG